MNKGKIFENLFKQLSGNIRATKPLKDTIVDYFCPICKIDFKINVTKDPPSPQGITHLSCGTDLKLKKSKCNNCNNCKGC